MAGSHGSQPVAQQAIVLAFRLAKIPPNGRNGRKSQQGDAHGSQTTSHGWQTVLHGIGSHGWQATGSQGLQPFQTTERRPKMPASALAVAAKMTIAVNTDNKILCFISILLKNTVGEICWQRLPVLSLLGCIGKKLPKLHPITKKSSNDAYTGCRNKEHQTFHVLMQITTLSAVKTDSVIWRTIHKSQTKNRKKRKFRSNAIAQNGIHITFGIGKK